MTLNPFCIAGEESGTLTTHLYLELSMAFREAHIHKLILKRVGALVESNTEQERKKKKNNEKRGKTGRDRQARSSKYLRIFLS